MHVHSSGACLNEEYFAPRMCLIAPAFRLEAFADTLAPFDLPEGLAEFVL